MKWIEMIKLRSTQDKLGTVTKKLDLLSEIKNQNEGLVDIKIYRCHELNTDMSIHIKREAASPDFLKSTLGLTLSDELKKYGAINYSIWIENEDEN